MGADWTREEVEATVADYFLMLELELVGNPLDKTAHRRRLLPVLNNRSGGSVEFKHQNISAVLIDLGFPYIKGYKPRFNYQRLLIEVVSDRLANNREIVSLVESNEEQSMVVPAVEDILKVLTDPPRTKPILPRVGEEPTQYIKRTSSVNYLEREARNQKLGLAGEEFILNFERARLISNGHETLASKIEHVSKKYGDAEGYDILSFESTGEERLIEVKTTKYGAEIPFFVTQNELQVSQNNADKYHLYRVYSFRDNPHLFTLPGSLSSTCILNPTAYIARVGQ